MKKLHVLLASVAMMASADAAFAQSATGGFGQTLTNVNTGLFGPIGDTLLGFSFLCGVVSAIIAITVLWKNSRNNHDPNASPVAAFKWATASACLLALPIFMGLSVTTFFGSGGTKSSIAGQLRSVE